MSDEKKGPNGSGSYHGYSVEARYNYTSPVAVGDMVFDNRWRAVSFSSSSSFGVPAGAKWDMPEYQRTGTMSYQAAQAMRWWLHAEVESSTRGGGLCLETRIVKHKITYSYSCERVSEHDTISGDDRSNCVPDWGAKKSDEAPKIAAE